MEALGELAADGIVDPTKELSQLTTALHTQAGTTPKETQAFGKIAGILTQAVSDGWRKRQLQELIGQSNDPLQTILKSLKQIVVHAFAGDDQTEQLTIQRYYGTKIAQSNDPAGIAALMEWQELRVGALADHRQAIQTYASLLDEIAEGHQKLYDERKDLAQAQLVQEMKQSVEELKDLLDTIKKL